jgi:hypothetical protein
MSSAQCDGTPHVAAKVLPKSGRARERKEGGSKFAWRVLLDNLFGQRERHPQGFDGGDDSKLESVSVDHRHAAYLLIKDYLDSIDHQIVRLDGNQVAQHIAIGSAAFVAWRIVKRLGYSVLPD